MTDSHATRSVQDEDDESEYDEEGVSIKKGPYKMGKPVFIRFFFTERSC